MGRKGHSRVEWRFLDRMMHKLGFSSKWLERMMNYVSSASFSFLINGEVCSKLKQPRGLSQGNPLSLYLFLLCVEGLSCVLNLVVSNGDLNGFRYTRNGLKISHLFFTDDSLIFSKAIDRDYATIRMMFDAYALALNQVINFDKPAVFVSRLIFRGKGLRLAGIMRIQLVKCHERYLGLPGLNCRNKRQLFSDIKDRVWAKIKD
ncbi:hypothetical protein Ddye_021092 [Dipteronia dyeriana]|uniref:Reverse transcriptase domain-containing protein n=1 Tax=Dipteronia dyeriana TaxID=168575 RepID=A0AAD9U1J9_9ROSI|nr:hypothetical protein Ddye_021092 [Dipteronia dyeriana]